MRGTMRSFHMLKFSSDCIVAKDAIDETACRSEITEIHAAVFTPVVPSSRDQGSGEPPCLSSYPGQILLHNKGLKRGQASDFVTAIPWISARGFRD